MRGFRWLAVLVLAVSALAVVGCGSSRPYGYNDPYYGRPTYGGVYGPQSGVYRGRDYRLEQQRREMRRLEREQERLRRLERQREYQRERRERRDRSYRHDDRRR